MASWYTHLELLALTLAGRPAPWPWDRWHGLQNGYADAVASDGP